MSYRIFKGKIRPQFLSLNFTGFLHHHFGKLQFLPYSADTSVTLKKKKNKKANNIADKEEFLPSACVAE